MRPRSGAGCRREEGTRGDGRGVWSVGKGKIKPSRERRRGAEDFISPGTRLNFCYVSESVSAFAVSSGVLLSFFLAKRTREWTRQLVPLRSDCAAAAASRRLAKGFSAMENVSQLMTFVCVSP